MQGNEAGGWNTPSPRGPPERKPGEWEWSDELTPVTRGGCNHVSAVPCFLDWTVGPVPSHWSPALVSVLSHAFANARIQYTRANLARSVLLYTLLFPRLQCHAHPRSLSPFLSFSLSFSRCPAGSRRAQMRLSRQRARSGHRTSFLFLRRDSLILCSPDISSFCCPLRHCDSFTSLLIAFLARTGSHYLVIPTPCSLYN